MDDTLCAGQFERTSLAWRRTGLSLLLAAAVEGRMAVDGAAPAVGLALAVLAAACAGFTVAVSGRRYRTAPRGDTVPVRLSGGGALLLVALACTAVSLTALRVTN